MSLLVVTTLSEADIAFINTSIAVYTHHHTSSHERHHMLILPLKASVDIQDTMILNESSINIEKTRLK